MLCSLADGAEESAVAVSLVFVASVGSEVFEVPEVVESELDVVDEVVLDALEDFSEAVSYTHLTLPTTPYV